MRKWCFVLINLGLLLCSCASKEQLASMKSDFDIQIKEVKGTKVRFSITPENEYAYYVYGVINEDTPQFDASDADLIEEQLNILNDMYDIYLHEGQVSVSFTDVFCFRGPHELTSVDLSPGKDHLLLVFQIDPKTQKSIGELHKVPFRTKDIDYTDLSFDFEWCGDTLRIYPSKNDVAYFWDYENTQVIDNEYGSPYHYYYSLVDMYEKYGFMDSLTDKGMTEWVFPRDDKSLMEGEQCDMILAAYGDGEIRSKATILRFTWRKGRSVVDEYFGEF